jgi:hypothetical protein
MAKDFLVVTEDYNFLITEDPEMIMRTDDTTGEQVPVLDFNTKQPKYRVGVLMTKVPAPGEFRDKGEVIRVELTEEPGPEFAYGVPVSFRNLRIGLSTMPAEGACARQRHLRYAGLKYRAEGLSPAVSRTNRAA